ncbi:putative Protein FAM92B [Hypsibius exemplaris]|uniref:Uncharacterized protein n=1 Tax=Hypsibius exemplaris TaxID=2072580 RepID=A0A9X6NIX6_HYPEX|nr:putative Protein FAM92B [Hypsibius exemplaris]
MDPAPVEYQCKLMNNRVDNVSKHFSYFLQGFSSYARKLALLRDKGDDLVDLVTSLADTEPHNASSRKQLHEFAHWLAMLQDFRHLSATRIAAKILPTLQAYQKTTAELKAAVKKCTSLSDKTRSSLEAANKIRAKSGDTSAIFHTAFEVYRTNARDTAHQGEILRIHAKEFEENKLRDTQRCLLDFVRSEMAFHCRAIEMYTAAYRSLQAISPEEDLDEFLEAYELMDDTGNRESNLAHSVSLPTGQQRPQSSLSGGPRLADIRSSASQPVLHGDSDERRVDYATVGPGKNATNQTQSALASGGHQRQTGRSGLGTRQQRSRTFEESDTD